MDTHSSVLLDYGFIRSKMNESGVVTRAKCPLIRMRKMTEEESNYYLEKKAMDEGSIKREIIQGSGRLSRASSIYLPETS